MQKCNDRNICNAQLLHERHFQSCFGISNAVNRMRKWLSHAASLANQHYTAEENLSRTAPKKRGCFYSGSSSNLADDEKSEFLRARQLGIKSSSSSAATASSARHSAWMLFLQKIAFGTSKLTTTARRSLTKSTTSGDNDSSSSKDNDNDKPIYHHTLVYSIPTNCDKSLPPSATREEQELCFNKFVEETLKPTLEQQLLLTTEEKKQNALDQIFPPELVSHDNTSKNEKTKNNLSLRVLKLGEAIMFTAEREEKELFMTEVGKNYEEGSTSSNTADDLENTYPE